MNRRTISAASTATTTAPMKHQLDNTVERPSKRLKGDNEAGSRKQFLNSLRAICDRWAVHVKVDASSVGKVVDGKELLRLFLRDTLPPKGKRFPLQECECRHKDGYLPSGLEMCMTSGTSDNNKAQAFVMSDLKQTLRQWLKAHQKNITAVITDVEDSVEEEDNDVEESRSQPISLSSFDAEQYPSSPLKPGDVGWKRKTTKQRLTILFYLLAHSNSSEAFNKAFKQLCEPNLHLVHLCGCGLSTGTLHGACVIGSHLKLASAELNREHVHFHYVLAQLPSKESYLATLAAIKGGSHGKFDDVF